MPLYLMEVEGECDPVRPLPSLARSLTMGERDRVLWVVEFKNQEADSAWRVATGWSATTRLDARDIARQFASWGTAHTRVRKYVPAAGQGE